MTKRRVPTKEQVLARYRDTDCVEAAWFKANFPDDFAPAGWTDDQLAVSIRYDRGVLLVTNKLVAHVKAMGHRLMIHRETFHPGWGFNHGFVAWRSIGISPSQNTAPEGWRGTSMPPGEAAQAMALITEAAKVEA